MIQTLESTGVPGYTEMPKMIGRGRHIRHFDNAVWPGATGCVFTVVTPDGGGWAAIGRVGRALDGPTAGSCRRLLRHQDTDVHPTRARGRRTVATRQPPQVVSCH